MMLHRAVCKRPQTSQTAMTKRGSKTLVKKSKIRHLSLTHTRQRLDCIANNVHFSLDVSLNTEILINVLWPLCLCERIRG
jgi:hypothetical protein